jgi:hypothetical protein
LLRDVRMRAPVVGSLLVVLAASYAPARADAYCRVTTCDATRESCPRDGHGCLRDGAAVAWASSCVPVAVHELGSELRGIDAADLSEALDRAIAVWAAVDCGGAPPSITLENAGTVACGWPEYNSTGGNANVLMIRDADWPYPGGADGLGRTALVWDRSTGELFDADVELNGFSAALSLDSNVPPSVDAIVTHELGHLLGLDHSDDESSVMWFGYDPEHAQLKPLSDDDAAGLCAIYPPDRVVRTTSCAPRHGFSSECGGVVPLAPAPPSPAGCQIVPAGSPGSAGALALMGFLALLRRAAVPARAGSRSRARPERRWRWARDPRGWPQ